MERIIYLDNELGYKFADIKNHQDLLTKQNKLMSKGYLIVCVLDLNNSTIIQQCESFSSHSAFVKSCYPKIELSQQSQNSIPQLVVAI